MPFSFDKYGISGVFHCKQITGIEPASPAWEAGVLPMNYICMGLVYHRKIKKKRKIYFISTWF